jgi:ribonuclease BN (tRNA processing enzyme)
VRVHFLGVRGSTPAPGAEFVRYGGHTSSVALSHDDHDRPSLILDAGTGIRRATELLGGRPFEGTVLLSHLHWDHVHGLPFFTGADRVDARADVYLPEPPDGAEALEVLARGMSPPHFPVRAEQLRGRWSVRGLAPGEYEFDGFTVTALEVPHKGGRTFGYRVHDGRSSVTYIPDHYPSVLGDGPDGWGEYHPSAVALAQDVDVLIHDSQLVAEELAAEAWFGHAAAEYTVALARHSGARRAVLYHYKPDRTDDALDVIAERFVDDPQVTFATQSLVLEL